MRKREHMGGLWDDLFGTSQPMAPDLSNSDFPPQPTSDPFVLKQIVPTGTPRPNYVTAVSIGFPSAAYDTWYFPTQSAVYAGKAQAAIDTVVATGDQIGAAISKVADVGSAVASNLLPILLGIAAIILLSKFGGKS